MAHTYLKTATSRKKTPQSKPIPGSTQVENSAGGFVFGLDKWKRMERFLILGSEGNTYYTSEQKLTTENVGCLRECLQEDSARYVQLVSDISIAGRAPKNDQAIAALALASAVGDDNGRRLAHAAIIDVCRIGTHLFQFVDLVQGMRGWGRGLRSGVADWYLSKRPENLAYQLVKYQQRNGWSHRDVLRLSHPKVDGAINTSMTDLFRRAVGKPMVDHEAVPALIEAVDLLVGMPKPGEPAHTKKTLDEAYKLIVEHSIPREAIPTEWLNDKYVWEALMQKMPYTAMVRNLGKMTNVGVFGAKGSTPAAKKVASMLTDGEALRKARVHPVSLLLASSTYSSGHGMRGKLTWDANKEIVDALDKAFTLAFKYLEPTGKRYYIGLDVSGSMVAPMNGYPSLTVREGAAAMAMSILRSEESVYVAGFTAQERHTLYNRHSPTSMQPLEFTKNWTLSKMVGAVSNMNFGRTDCALPMLDALERKQKVDAFIIFTDNETWAGTIHPVQALQQYREQMGIPAKLIVCGMTSTGFTIADPNDAGMLDVVGFDSNVPALISDFVGGGSKQKAVEDEPEEL